MKTTNNAYNSINSWRNRHEGTVTELGKYKLIIESIQDYAIFLMDPSGHIMTWNKGAERNKGYKPEEIIGKHFSVFYSETDNAAQKPERELRIATKVGRIEDEDWRIRKDGTRFWANVVITALRDDTGELVGFAKVTRDLTERKQQEDELRRANSQLRQQQVQLRALNDSKDEFISLASHQLRTPATAVKLLLGMLLDDASTDLSPNSLRYIQKAYDSNERQIATVNSLLRVAQVDSGKLVLRKTQTDLAFMLRSIVDEQQDTFLGRDQLIILQADWKCLAYVDQGHMRMALENIIENASKYTHDGGKITISLLESDGKIKISVKDSGVGIAPDDIELLFQKFHRIPNDLSERSPGTGLGLFWSSKVIELHDGYIEVESKVGEGTTFMITLPIGTASA